MKIVIITPESRIETENSPYLESATVGTIVFIGTTVYKVKTVETGEDAKILTVEPTAPKKDPPSVKEDPPTTSGLQKGIPAGMMGGGWMGWL